MSVRFLLTAGLATLLLGGCRNDPHMQVYIDNVNAEKRLLEDTLYDLQYDYECKIQEVEKLRSEVTQLKSGATTGGTSRPATGSSRKSDTPSAPGDKMFPDIPDLKPPTVEPGTPEKSRPPAKDSPRELDNMDDLEPPTLDLGEKKSDVSAVPKPANGQALEQQRDITITPPGKLASRWTPRAERRPEPPKRRIDAAESAGEERTNSDPPASDASGPTSPSPSSAGSAPQQAQRPQWRPYR